MTNMNAANDTTRLSHSTVDRCAIIRNALKAKGWTSRMVYGEPVTALEAAAVLILEQPYRPRALPLNCSDGALRFAVYVPARTVKP